MLDQNIEDKEMHKEASESYLAVSMLLERVLSTGSHLQAMVFQSCHHSDLLSNLVTAQLSGRSSRTQDRAAEVA